MPTHYTYTEAARILGVSRRTISRRIQSGELPTVEVDGARRVVLDIPDGAQSVPDAPTGMPVPTPAQDAEIAALRAQLAAVESERDHLRATVDKLAGTVDRLTISLAQLSGAVVDQQVLAAGVDTSEDDTAPPEPVQRPWWAFWRA
ncbi:MAG: excisionase family DNA-binding protein [Chloroflexota bacterium]|nr:excisionase family DNA-binding protein [Chloroflexota bacterium]